MSNNFKYLQECEDFDKLKNHYSQLQLEDFDKVIGEYEDSECSEEDFEEHSKYGYGDVINWYNGMITTEDLFEFIETIE